MLKLAADTQSSTLNMAATSAYLTRFDIDAHLAQAVIPVYRHKRDLMLADHGGGVPRHSVRVDRAPTAGCSPGSPFPPGFDAGAFMADVLLPEAKVAYVPGATFFPVDHQPQHARVSYSGVPDKRLVAGITALGRLFKRELG